MGESYIRVLGVFHVPITQTLFDECVQYLYGSDMSDERRRDAEADCREQLESVKLVEIEVGNGGEEIDFGKVTQEIPGKSPSDWQVAYDEQELEKTTSSTRWAFFFHYLNLSEPLLTPFGAVSLPEATELPKRLNNVDYFPP